MEKGDHRDPFGEASLSSNWAVADARHTPKTQEPYSYLCSGGAGSAAAAGTRGREWPLEQHCVCGRLEPRKPGEAPFLVPQPQASTVRLYLMPRSISERAWVLCVCLSSDRRRPPREGPSPQPPPCSHSRPNAAWRGRLIRKQAEGLLAPSTGSGSPLPHEPA